MWNRIVRLLTALFNAYSLYQNPVKYLVSVVAVLLVPYLIYIFWGTLIIIALIITGIYAVYKLFTRNKKRRYY